MPGQLALNVDIELHDEGRLQIRIDRLQLRGQWDVMAGYVGSRGKNLLRLGDANLAPEQIINGVKTYQPQLGRRNANFAGHLAANDRRRVVL